MNIYKTPSLNIFMMVRYTIDLPLPRERKPNDRFDHLPGEFQDSAIAFLNSQKEARAFEHLK